VCEWVVAKVEVEEAKLKRGDEGRSRDGMGKAVGGK